MLVGTRVSLLDACVLSTTVFLASCAGNQPPPETAPPPVAEIPPAPIETTTAPPPETTPSEDGAPTPEPPAAKPVVRYEGLSTPESVLHDEAQDRYLVSNINGSPLEKDNNGFISELAPDGSVKNLRFIAGGEKKVTLNAPKGLLLVNDVLYVTDIDVVRRFDAKTGAPKGDIAVPGAHFLNDLAAAPDGRVFVSDSGPKMEGPGAVYVIDKAGKVKPFATGELGAPNGLWFRDGRLLVATIGSNDVYELDASGKRTDLAKLPKGGLDGIVLLADGTLLISSWEGSAVYRGSPGGTFEAVIAGIDGPADIGFDAKRGLVLVPRFNGNAVEAYALP
ncbi:MAG: SMP-30/gluconolactonase/LRE family protein [Pseudomonadota bacterium]